jgi:hypothetical protein
MFFDTVLKDLWFNHKAIVVLASSGSPFYGHRQSNARQFPIFLLKIHGNGDPENTFDSI